MAHGLIVRVTHIGSEQAPILVSDVADTTNAISTSRRAGAVYIPIGGYIDLIYSSSVAKSVDNGSLKILESNSIVTITFIIDGALRDAILGITGVTTIAIEDEGNAIGIFDTVNFIGATVSAQDSGTLGVVNVLIPPGEFQSHWDTDDGDLGSAQLVTESITRTSARIASPGVVVGGIPFETAGWESTDHDAHTDTVVTFTTPGSTTGFGGDSTMTVRIYDADGVSVLDTYTTPVITADGANVGTYTTVTISGYAVDGVRFSANASVVVDLGALYTTLGREGSRYHVEIDHTVDTTTDGGGTFTYTQTDVFLDDNATTPSIDTSVTIAETGGSVVTKHISGIEYYTTGSDFTVGVTNIDQINRNTARSNLNLTLDGSEYGLSTLNHSPFGTGSGNFSGYTYDYDLDNLPYSNTAWAVDVADHRYMGPTGSVSATPRDTWADGVLVASSDDSILVDTHIDNSDEQFLDFNGESRRSNSTFTAAWTSTSTLSSGEAIVFNGNLMVPNATTLVRSDGANSANADWTGYAPTTGGANPDYSTFGAPANSYWEIEDYVTDTDRASMQLVFEGTSLGVDFLTDLENSDLEIFIYRREGEGATGPPPGNTTPLLLHGVVYNFSTFDDGATDGQIREASSSGDTINATFGGLSAKNGFHMHIRINDATIEIDTITVTFF